MFTIIFGKEGVTVSTSFRERYRAKKNAFRISPRNAHNIIIK
jgi:hypothetical protein